MARRMQELIDAKYDRQAWHICAKTCVHTPSNTTLTLSTGSGPQSSKGR